MNKTIENKLFTEFEIGAAALCLNYVMEVIINKRKNLPSNSKKWRKIYKDIPQRVAELTDAFDDVAWPINIKGHYRIAQEISDNLDNCKNDNDRERYICSILQVFEEWEIAFTPISQIQTFESILPKISEGLAFNTEAEIRAAIDRTNGMHDRLLEIMHNAKEGTIEAYFHQWYNAYYDFCNMLAAICTEHGINLLEIQNRRGIWLVSKLDVMQIQLYFGYDSNYNYANSLLKALPRTSATEHLIHTEKDGCIDTEAKWNNQQVEDMSKVEKISGRPKNVIQPLLSKMIGNEQERQDTLDKLHKLIDGKKGKAVALAVYGCVQVSKMHRPTFSQLKNEFGDIGNESGYYSYYREAEYKFTKDEIANTIAIFR